MIVPVPIIGKDKNCTISVERLLPNFELAYISGQGFPPNSDVSFVSQSYGGSHPHHDCRGRPRESSIRCVAVCIGAFEGFNHGEGNGYDLFPDDQI